MKFFNTLFVSSDGRVRAGWRLLLQAALSVLFLVPLQFLASLFGGRNLQIIAGGVAITLAVMVAGVMLDKRPIRDFGLRINRQWWRGCLAGFLMAALVMTLIVLIQWLLGWIEFTGFGWNRSSGRNFILMLSGYILTMAVVGFYEELWTRGYQLKNLTEGFNTGKSLNMAGIGAIAITSLLFGALHLANPNATAFGTAVIVMAGVMLAIPYVMTGQLGYSVGLHFSWNVIQGAVYGLPVSGIPFRQSVLQSKLTGPEIWTGGGFGPEGGLFGVLGVLLLIVISIFWLRRQGFPLAVHENLVKPPSSAAS